MGFLLHSLTGLGLVLAPALASAQQSKSAADPSLAPAPTREAPPDRGARRLWFDVELDPFAYLFEGYSLHVGLRTSQVRVDLGAFAAKYPAMLSANPDLEGRGRGAGLKVDWRPFQRPEISSRWLTELGRGAFVGASTSYAWLDVRDPVTTISASQFHIHTALRAGWDVPIAAGFYVVPWASVAYVFGAEPIALGNQTWDTHQISLFATVHAGWRSPWL
jgi:hypothetical protein